MAISIINEMSSAGALLSPFMRPVLYFSVSGASGVTSPTAEIEFSGTTEDVTIEAVYLRTASSTHYFSVDLSDVMKYLMRSFDGGSYPDDLEFINGNLLQKFDEYFRSLEMDIYFERGTGNQQTLSVAHYWLYLANQIPYSEGFKLENVRTSACLQALKWSKNTYNGFFFWHPGGTLSITKGGDVLAALTADSGSVTGDSDITADSVSAGGVPEIDVVYGFLYNWYAATDPRNIAASGWHVPTLAEYITMISYIDPLVGVDGSETAGGNLKEAGLTHWNAPNTGATNSVGFNARGAGIRSTLGEFSLIKEDSQFMVTDDLGSGRVGIVFVTYNSAWVEYSSYSYKYNGDTIRLLKDSTTLTHGQTGIYTGNDGKVYRTICIGTQEWLADNLCETQYRNGDIIPEVTDNAAWVALITGARCSYGNDEANAFTVVDTSVTIHSGTETAGYFQYKFAKTSIYLDKGKNLITVTTPAGSKSIIIDYDPDCASVVPVCWQHPLLGYVSFPFTGNKLTNISGKKGVELDKNLTTLVNVNSLKEITGYEESRRITISTKADDDYWPLLSALYSSRHVYIFVGADGANDTAGTWLECEVSGSASYRSNKSRETFTVELILPEPFNVRF